MGNRLWRCASIRDRCRFAKAASLLESDSSGRRRDRVCRSPPNRAHMLLLFAESTAVVKATAGVVADNLSRSPRGSLTHGVRARTLS